MTSKATPLDDSTLRDARLLIPTLQAEPFAVQAVEPSPCTEACPAGINVKSYVSLIAEERFAEALEVVRERCPLPGVCGRICHHPCEDACKRCDVDEAIAIRSLKRFVSDLVLELPPPEPPPAADKSEKVAIIGSGPAGLTAAYDLRLAGYPVKVFETEPEPGGMLRYGIADYRLPAEVLDAEIRVLTSAGIEIETGCRIGQDRQLEDLLNDGYAAVLFAVGAQRGRQLRIEGEDECPQVQDALSFLRLVNIGKREPVSGTVLVIGGGSTAIEAARAALRLGAERVEIVYRRHRGEMPADEEEIEIAVEEGIVLRLLTAPARIVTSGSRLEGLECLKVALGEPDDSGRRRPIPIPGSEFVIAADRILAAVGQEAELDFLPEDVAAGLAERGLLKVDPLTSMTAMPGVFAAGDVVTGPSTVIDAIAAGHDAAQAILEFLEPAEAAERATKSTKSTVEYEIPTPPPPPLPRARPTHAPITPGHEFDEVERAFSAADAVAEAKRCMRCGPCSECLICASSCGRRHVTLRTGSVQDGSQTMLLRAPARIAAALDGDAVRVGAAAASAWLLSDIEQRAPGALDRPLELLPNRITIDEEHCRGCARCIEVCSFGAISLVDSHAPETAVRVSAALCRGCNLCTAVCPTDAAVPSTVAPGWWGASIEDLYPSLIAASASQPPLVALACQRRAGAVQASLAESGIPQTAMNVVPVRCAGQIDAGMLLEIYRHGAGRIVVAGCVTGTCRYGFGPQLAAEQVIRARSTLSQVGADSASIETDWAAAETDRLASVRLFAVEEIARKTVADRNTGGAE